MDSNAPQDVFDSNNTSTPSPNSTMVTRTTEETLQYDGINFFHRRTETTPVSMSSSGDIPINVHQQQPRVSQMTQYIPEGIRSTISTTSEYLSGIATSLATRFPNFRGFVAPRSLERWTLRIFTSYTNEKHENLNDSMELQFGSQEAAEKYWEHFQQDMMLSGNAVPCTVQIFKGDQPPPPSAFSNIPQ